MQNSAGITKYRTLCNSYRNAIQACQCGSNKAGSDNQPAAGLLAAGWSCSKPKTLRASYKPSNLTCQCGSKTASSDSQPAVGLLVAPLSPQPCTGRTLNSQLQASTVDMGAPVAPASLDTCIEKGGTKCLVRT